MDWQILKKSIYYCDGSWRDIYIINATIEDWQTWADFVNNHYESKFNIYDTLVQEENVDLTKIIEYWDGKHENSSTVTVDIGGIHVNAHFFSQDEIENDINPDEISAIEDHDKLLNYMVEISKVLNRKVVLTLENSRESVLISVEKAEVVIKNY